jgi:RHS repeat-associated protein
MPTDKQYTGQQVEPGDPLGLYNYRARMYSTVTGRFVSADTEISGEYDPQAWNGYAYVRNNPLRFTDPTGKRRSDIEDEALANAAIGAAWKAAADAYAAAAQAQDWASQPFNPPPPCVACNAMIAAAQAYQDAAAAQTWASTVAQGAGPGSPASSHSGSMLGNIASGAMGGAEGAIGAGIACAGNALCKAVAAAAASSAVPVGLGLLGALASPCDACSKIDGPREGTTVYRVWGGDAPPNGHWWTTIDPRTVPNYRDAAGLPEENTGQHLSVGTLVDNTGVTPMPATSLGGRAGGLPSLVVPHPEAQIRVALIETLDPPY